MRIKFIVSFLLLVAIFTIPYFFPPTELVASMSYDYGFNNTVGLLVVAFSILVLAVLAIVNRDKNYTLIFDEKSSCLPLSAPLVASVVISLYCIVVAWLCGDYLSYVGGESSYFLPHLYDMKYGKIPYVDFIFYYGPLMIYVPYSIYLIIPGLSILWAYNISLILFSIVGVFMLYQLVNALNLEKSVKMWLFVLLVVFSIPYEIGMNYELLRFVTPLWCFWKLDKINNKWSVLFYPLTIIFSMAISPELGLVYLIATLTYCIAKYVATRQTMYIEILVLSVVLPLIFMVLYREMFQYLLSFGSGLMNYPYVLSYYILIFFISVFIISLHLGALLREWKQHIFEIGFIILSFGLIPGCLGRNDSRHIIYDSLFIIPMAVVLIVHRWPKYTRMAQMLVSIMFVIPLLALTYQYTLVNTSNTFRNHPLLAAKVKPKLKSVLLSCGVSTEKIGIWGEMINKPYDVSYDFLPQNSRIAMPFGSLYEYMKLTEEGKLENLYVTRIVLTGNQKNISRMIEELEKKKPPYLLLYENWDEITQPTPFEYSVRYLFFAYYPLKPYRNGNMVYQPLVDYVKDHYHAVKKENNYLLYQLK